MGRGEELLKTAKKGIVVMETCCRFQKRLPAVVWRNPSCQEGLGIYGISRQWSRWGPIVWIVRSSGSGLKMQWFRILIFRFKEDGDDNSNGACLHLALSSPFFFYFVVYIMSFQDANMCLSGKIKHNIEVRWFGHIAQSRKE